MMDDDLMERVLWQKLQGAGGFFFFSLPFCFFPPPARVSFGFFVALIKKEVKIEGAIVLSLEKNGAGKINRLMPRK